MAAEITAHDFIDSQGIINELGKINGGLLQIIETGKKIGVNIKAAENIQQIKEETVKLTASQLELQKVEKQIVTAQAKNNDEYIKAKKNLNDLNQTLKQKTALGDKDSRTINAQNSSLKELIAALNKNRDAYKSLANEEARMSKEGQELKAIIDAQDKAVKQQNASLGDFRDNVGNYEGALKSLKLELKAAKDEMAFLAKTTGASSPEFIEASKKAGDLKDQVDELNDAIKNTGASKFENVGNSLKDIGSKLANLDFDGAASAARQFASNVKAISFSDIIGGLKNFGSALVSVGRVILTNPIFIIAGVITGVVLAFKYFYDQQEKNRERAIEGYKREEEALTSRYDKEIKLQKIVGKQTFELEKEKQKVIANSTDKQIEALTNRNANIKALIKQGATLEQAIKFVNDAETLYDKEKIERLDDLRKQRQAALDEIIIITAEQAEFERKTAEDVAKFKREQLFEIQKFQLQLSIDGQKEIYDNEKNSYTVRIGALNKFLQLSNQMAKLERDYQLDQEELTAEEKVLIDLKFEKQITENRKAVLKERAEIEDQIRKQTYERIKAAGAQASKSLDNVGEKAAEVFNNPVKVGAGTLFGSIETGIQKVTDTARFKFNQMIDHLKESLELARNVWGDFTNNVGALVDSLTERRLQNIDREERRLDEQTQKRIIAAGDNENAVARIEADAELRRQALEKKRIQAQRKAAIFDKATAVTMAGINTALGITKTISQLGFPAAIPFIVLTAAMGAIQTAAILAKPIPQYFRGTKSAEGGPAWVGERGVELMKKPGQDFELTPSVATLMDVPRGTQIIPHGETMRMLAAGALQQNGGSIVNHDSELLQEMKSLNSNISKIKPVRQNLIRSGAVVYHAIKDSEGHTKVVRGINLGKWF